MSPIELTVIGPVDKDKVMETVAATGFFERASQYQAEVDRRAEEGLSDEDKALLLQWRAGGDKGQRLDWNKTMSDHPEAYSAIMYTISMGCG